jgi:D-2-hydroxyacid dehydrogenase (NADP+)
MPNGIALRIEDQPEDSMADRPRIQKIVFTYEPDQRLVDAVEQVVPGVIHVTTTTDGDLVNQMTDAQMTIGPGYSGDILANARGLVWHHVPWAGVEHMALNVMAERGVILTNSRGISAPNMAEHAIAFILAFGRAFPTFFEQQQRRAWREWEDAPAFSELTNQTVVLLGTGAIGKAIASRLKPFGCRIVGVRRTGGQIDAFDKVVTFDQLPAILPAADHVVSSLPMTSSTAKIVDRGFIQSMKPGSYFHNVGRGGTVDQDALIEGLVSGHLAGAGLDVTDPEPLPADSPLWDTPNTIITGHTSGNSSLFAARGADVLRENLRRYQSGEELLNVVDMEFGY